VQDFAWLKLGTTDHCDIKPGLEDEVEVDNDA
jgi:hypothetical protein